MIGKYHFLYLGLILLLTASCGNNFEQLASETPPENAVSQNTSSSAQQARQFYTVTNDFQDYRGADSGVYIYLTSVNTGQTYIVPPTKYSSVELEYVIMEAKVEGKCVQVPTEAFPLLVSVCKSRECASVRSLDVLLKNPAHYNINGIGGLLIPQIYPVSPCSKEFVNLIGNEGEYKTL